MLRMFFKNEWYEFNEKKEIVEFLQERNVIKVMSRMEFFEDSDFRNDGIVVVRWATASGKRLSCEKNNYDAIITFATMHPGLNIEVTGDSYLYMV
ncbi:MAG: hypothetical protein IIT46_00170 [Lachnospiraceae bacterium]|nr:hypothetical protein [Lachnospiraceae bacterium]